MPYAELTYFDGAYFAHIAARDEYRLREHRRKMAQRALR